MNRMKGSRFDLEAYLEKLKWERHTRTKRRAVTHFSKHRHCVYSKDPVKNDLIWRSIVEGENSATRRRETDYASTQELYKSCSSRSRSSSDPSSESSQSGPPRNDDIETLKGDAFLRRSHHYAHVSQGPALPATSSRFIGWRSTLPELRLERYDSKK